MVFYSQFSLLAAFLYAQSQIPGHWRTFPIYRPIWTGEISSKSGSYLVFKLCGYQIFVIKQVSLKLWDLIKIKYLPESMRSRK